MLTKCRKHGDVVKNLEPSRGATKKIDETFDRHREELSFYSAAISESLVQACVNILPIVSSADDRATERQMDVVCLVVDPRGMMISAISVLPPGILACRLGRSGLEDGRCTGPVNDARAYIDA